MKYKKLTKKEKEKIKREMRLGKNLKEIREGFRSGKMNRGPFEKNFIIGELRDFYEKFSPWSETFRGSLKLTETEKKYIKDIINQKDDPKKITEMFYLSRKTLDKYLFEYFFNTSLSELNKKHVQHKYDIIKKEKKAEIENKLKNGVSVKEIAKSFSMSRDTLINKVLKPTGLHEKYISRKNKAKKNKIKVIKATKPAVKTVKKNENEIEIIFKKTVDKALKRFKNEYDLTSNKKAKTEKIKEIYENECKSIMTFSVFEKEVLFKIDPNMLKRRIKASKNKLDKIPKKKLIKNKTIKKEPENFLVEDEELSYEAKMAIIIVLMVIASALFGLYIFNIFLI